MKKLLNRLIRIFIYNGFEPEQITPIRYQLVAVTADQMKKLAMGLGMLYTLSLLLERNLHFFALEIEYMLCFTVYLLLLNLYKQKKNPHIQELAIVQLVISVLAVAIVDSTVLSPNSRGAFFPIFMILLSIMFTGNPIAIDFICFVMTMIYFVVSYHVKTPVYFKQDLFTGLFAYLISNMVNAMVARTRIETLLKTRELEESRERYKTLYEAVPCSILEYRATDKGQQPLSANEQALKLLGFTEEALQQKPYLHLLERTHPEDCKNVKDTIATLQKIGDNSRYEYRLRRPDGSYIWILGQAQVVGQDAEGLRVLSAAIDEDAEKKAIDANEAKSRFLSRMSHDIRTPMNAIIGLTDIVLDTPKLSAPVRENMNAIKTSSEFLLGLINDILDVSKIEAGKMELHPEPYTMQEFVGYLNTLIRPLCEKKNIDFVVDTAHTDCDCILLDKVRFNQVFFNLLSNAVKFTPAGGRVYVGINELDRQGDIVTQSIVISDNGIGMSEEFQKRMFDPFSQENAEHINETQGSGIGLAIVKRVVELMHGKIEVDSAPGKGTSYTITLAMQACEAPAASAPQRDVAALQGCRVLLCEDHPVNRRIAVTILQKVGIVTDTAEDGAKGLALYEQAPADYYDAVLMDIRMPVMSGLEAAQKIRDSGKADCKTIPVLAMTANAFDADREKSMAVGMNDHLIKPIEPEALYAALCKYIRPRATTDAR